MKTYALEVVEFCDGHEDLAGFYTKGHFTDDEFRTAILTYVHEQEYDDEDHTYSNEVMQATIERTWWRTINQGPDVEWYLLGEQGRPGVYPVTKLNCSI